MSGHLIKISNDLIEQPQTLEALMVDVGFRIELLKVRDRGKEHTHTFVGLVVEVLGNNQSYSHVE